MTAKLKQKQAQDGINQLHVSRTLLRIVAELNEKQYTEGNSTQNGRQAEVVEHNDLSNPASDVSTTQG